MVANVFNYGASDLLQVMLNSETADSFNSSKPETDSSGQMVLVPFVEAIVPEVDMDKREMCITPPKGLLELNLRYDMRSKKERRQLVRSASFNAFQISNQWKGTCLVILLGRISIAWYLFKHCFSR